VDKSLYSANTNFLENIIVNSIAENKQARHLILICSAINRIDLSAIEALDAINERLQQVGVLLYPVEEKGPDMDKLKRQLLFKSWHQEKYFSKHMMRWLSSRIGFRVSCYDQ